MQMMEIGKASSSTRQKSRYLAVEFSKLYLAK
jgi:hypothetical protein